MSGAAEARGGEQAPSPPGDKVSFTSWKLDLLTAINLDPAVRPVDMRFVVYLVQGLNQRSRSFNVSDETACEELNCKRDKLTDARKRLEASGWLTVQRGRGFGDGSWYEFNDTQVEQRLQEKEDRSAARRDTWAERRVAKVEQAKRCAGKSRHSAETKSTPSPERCAGKTPHNGEPCAGKTPHRCAGKTPHIHLLDTPISGSLPVEDMTPEPPPTEAFDRSEWDHGDWQALFEERAGTLEWDGGYSRVEAEQMAAVEISKMRATA